MAEGAVSEAGVSNGRPAVSEAGAAHRRPTAGVGLSVADDARAAGREAADRACATLSGGDPGLVIVTASAEDRLDRLLEGVRAVTGDTPLVGATADGQLVRGTYVRRGTGVGVCVVPGGAHRFGTAVIRGLASHPDDVGRAVARAARDAVPGGPGPADAVILLSDGLQPGQQALLHGVHRVAGARVPIGGGTAAGDRRGRHTFVFHDGEAFADAAVAVWVASEGAPRVVLSHAWEPASAPLLVTRATGPVIHELDGRPAADVYAELLQADPDATEVGRDDPFPLHLLRPLGLLQPDGSHLIRAVRTHREAGDLPPHALLAFSDVPANAAVQLMRGSCESLLESTKRLVAEALAGEIEPSCLLVFSCAIHDALCGDRIDQQVGRLQEVAGRVPTFGIHSYGEFARTVGGSGFHNATLSAMVL